MKILKKKTIIELSKKKKKTEKQKTKEKLKRKKKSKSSMWFSESELICAGVDLWSSKVLPTCQQALIMDSLNK